MRGHISFDGCGLSLESEDLVIWQMEKKRKKGAPAEKYFFVVVSHDVHEKALVAANQQSGEYFWQVHL